MKLTSMSVYVRSDYYMQAKKRYEDMGMSSDHIIPVDMTGAYVPFDKDDPDNLAKTEQLNNERFGFGGDY